MNIAVVSDQLAGFPYGYAAINQVRLMGKGLAAAGCRVAVLISGCVPRRLAIRAGLPANGSIDGVEFEHVAGTALAPGSFWARRWIRLTMRDRLRQRLRDLVREGRLDALIYYGRNPKDLETCLDACSPSGVPVVVYVVEWSPACDYLSEPQRRIEARFYRKMFCGAAAALAISQYLEERCREGFAACRRPSVPCHRLPVLTDPERWEGLRPSASRRPYFLYCANLENYLADALFVIESFVRTRTADCDLLLVGHASNAAVARILRHARESGFSDRIRVETSYLSDADLLSAYAGAVALLAPLRDDEQSRARFPLKIADYLMSGRPVVSSPVGEIARFLRDGESAFLCPPGDPDAFARGMCESFDAETARRIGDNGRRVAMEHFDCRKRCRSLLKFLETCPR